MKTQTKVRTEVQTIEKELRRLNRAAGKAVRQGTPEHREIFEKHRKAWEELAKR